MLGAGQEELGGGVALHTPLSCMVPLFVMPQEFGAEVHGELTATC